MYRSVPAGITPEEKYLVWFYDNVLNNAGHPLDREQLVCSELFENPKLLRNVSPRDAIVKSS